MEQLKVLDHFYRKKHKEIMEVARDTIHSKVKRIKKTNDARIYYGVYEIGRTETFSNSKTHLTIRRTKIRGQVSKEKPSSRVLRLSTAFETEG